MNDERKAQGKATEEAKQQARDDAKKLRERQERHVVPLSKFGALAGFVLDEICVGLDDTEARQAVVEEMASLLNFDRKLISGKVVKNEKHFMMTPIESIEDAKNASEVLKANKADEDQVKARLRRRCLADIIGNFDHFAALDTRNNEINQLVSILGLSTSAATKMWDDKNKAISL